MTKKLHRIILLIPLLTIFLAPFALNTSVSAADPVFTGRTGDGCQGFLGLTSWDCGVTIETENQNSLVSSAVTIAANVLVDITVIANYLVLGYVIYGGYLYTFSGGDPSKVATGKKTLTQAFIGFAIVMLAHIIINSIRIALMGAGGSFAADCASTACANPGKMVTSAVQWVVGIAGAVSAIFVVYGGISYITSAGDPSKVEKGKKMITYALIGLAIVALAEIIIAFVTNNIIKS